MLRIWLQSCMVSCKCLDYIEFYIANSLLFSSFNIQESAGKETGVVLRVNTMPCRDERGRVKVRGI